MTTTLTCSPPAWPMLSAAAWALLAMEVVLLVRRQARGQPWAAALGVSAAALLAGPILALIGLFLGVMTAAGPATPPRGRAMLRAGLRGSAIALLTAVVWWGGAGGAIVALAVVCIFWAVRAYHQTTRPLQRRAKIWLLAARTIVILLIALWVLKPTWLHWREERSLPVLLAGADRSGSMLRRDATRDDGTLCSRQEALGEALRLRRGELRALQKQADVEWFAFDESPTPPTPSDDGATPADLWRDSLGSGTAIGDSAQGVFEALWAHGWDVAGVVLLTDGCNNLSRRVTPETFAARMGARGIPVYTVGVGSPTVTAGLRSLTVQSCGAPATADAFGTMTIRPVIEALGLSGRIVEVSCTFGQTKIGQKLRKITSNRANETFEFTHVPLQTGFHRLTVEARIAGDAPPAASGQPVADMLVQVTDREIRVLYVEGTYRYETKYITRALGSSKRITLHRWILNQPLRPDEAASPGEDIANWLGYHAILLGDVSADQFTPRQRAILKTLVDHYGKGLAMIGGENSFARGGWGQTELADVMPVDLKQSRDQIRRPIQPKPTREGETSAMMHIGSAGEDPAAGWAKLDALAGANLLVGVKPAATVLANLLTGEPMIVTQPYGKGRSAAIAFDTTWRWVLSPNTENTAAMQKRFWRQVVLYLAAPKGNVWIHTDRTTYDLEALQRGLQEVEVTAGVEDAQGRPRDAAVTVTLQDPTGETTPISLSTDGPVRRGMLVTPREEGVYTLTLSAEVDGKTLQTQQQFQAVRQDRESAQVLANFALLRTMADASQGMFVPLKDLPELLRRLLRDVQPRRYTAVTREDVLGPWRWWLFVLLVGLLCLEWILRKKRGLV
ncbi:MAG: hypothetical protein JW849_05670 [Phycisphaerae bacterium]|nr:hypothetical protein [Phycisphaerae bacterium]